MQGETIILESGLDVQDGKNMIFNIIDTQINNCKLQFLSKWEKNHKFSAKELDKEIERLNQAKNNLKKLFSQLSSENQRMFSISLNVCIKKNESSEVIKKSLVAF